MVRGARGPEVNAWIASWGRKVRVKSEAVTPSARVIVGMSWRRRGSLHVSVSYGIPQITRLQATKEIFEGAKVWSPSSMITRLEDLP